MAEAFDMSQISVVDIIAFTLLFLVILLLLLHYIMRCVMRCITRSRPDVLPKKRVRNPNIPKNITLFKEMKGAVRRLVTGERLPSEISEHRRQPLSIPDAASINNTSSKDAANSDKDEANAPNLDKEKSNCNNGPALITIGLSKEMEVYYNRDWEELKFVEPTGKASVAINFDGETRRLEVKNKIDKVTGKSVGKYVEVPEELAEYFEVIYKAYYADNIFTCIYQQASDAEMYYMKDLDENIKRKRHMKGSIVFMPQNDEFYFARENIGKTFMQRLREMLSPFNIQCCINRLNNTPKYQTEFSEEEKKELDWPVRVIRNETSSSPEQRPAVEQSYQVMDSRL